ncbi:MAG: ABC transporter permease [Thermoanaerobaculia bacterium]
MLFSYLKLAIKVLARRKFFTFVSLFGICFTLVVLLVAAAILDHLFAPHAPELKLDRILGVYNLHMSGPESNRTGPAGYAFLDRTLRDFPGAEVVSFGAFPDRVAVYGDGSKVELFLRRVDGNFWRIFDFELLAGELYTQADEENARFVAVVNRSTAERLFGNPAAALGKALEIDGQSFRICGVVEDVPFTGYRSFGDLWAPISTNKSTTYREHYQGMFMGFVLAKSRGDFPTLKATFQSRLAATPLPPADDQWTTMAASLDTPIEGIVNTFRLPSATWLKGFFIVLGLLFMVLPAINLVNLNLSRIMERASEIGVRRAFGARRGTLVWQFLVENAMLTLLGGLLGLVVSILVLEGINATGIIPRSDLTLNVRIFVYGMLAAFAFALLSGVYPAWRMSRLQPVEALKGTL